MFAIDRNSGAPGVGDAELVARAVAQNDPQAFGELVRRHQSRVRGFLRRLTRDTAFADDLAQDAFLHAWDKLHTYTGAGTFVGWLQRVAYTTFLQNRRKQSRYDEILTEIGDTAAGSAPPQNDEIPDLDRFLAVLSDDERAVMILSYAYGMSHREIADVTDMPVGTVKSIIFRGKEKIRESFDIEDHQYG